jgi:hypothetical protein
MLRVTFTRSPAAARLGDSLPKTRLRLESSERQAAFEIVDAPDEDSVP